MNSALFTIDKTFHTSHFCGKRAGKGVLGVYQSTVEVYISLSQYIERGGGGGGGVKWCYIYYNGRGSDEKRRVYILVWMFSILNSRQEET